MASVQSHVPGETSPSLYAHIPVPIVGPKIGFWHNSISLESRLISLKNCFWSKYCKRYTYVNNVEGARWKLTVLSAREHGDRSRTGVTVPIEKHSS